MDTYKPQSAFRVQLFVTLPDVIPMDLVAGP